MASPPVYSLLQEHTMCSPSSYVGWTDFDACVYQARISGAGLFQWTPGEDEVVRRAVAAAAGGAPAGSLNWAAVAALLPGRLTKQVREHQPAWKSTSEWDAQCNFISAQALAEPPGPASGEDALDGGRRLPARVAPGGPW